MTDELDLNNKEVVDQLIENDILKKKPSKEAQELETAIKEIDKLQSFTVKLTGAQVAILQRESSQLGISAKKHLQDLIDSKCFSDRVASPVISRVSHHKLNVVGPSSKSLVTRG